MAKKLSLKRLKFLIADEKKASKEYKKYGFMGLSRDEARHRKFLLRRLKKAEKRR